jgi:hypothetical protein
VVDEHTGFPRGPVRDAVVRKLTVREPAVY